MDPIPKILGKLCTYRNNSPYTFMFESTSGFLVPGRLYVEPIPQMLGKLCTCEKNLPL